MIIIIIIIIITIIIIINFVTRSKGLWQWGNLVTSECGAQIINNLWVWCSHHMLPMKNIINPNVIQRGTQTTHLGVMIGSCSSGSQHGDPANVGCSFSWYINIDISILSYQKLQRRKLTWEDNKLALYCYFGSNYTRSGYRKWMIEIWNECNWFKTTSQRLADQARLIIKKRWFSWSIRNTPTNIQRNVQTRREYKN